MLVDNYRPVNTVLYVFNVANNRLLFDFLNLPKCIGFIDNLKRINYNYRKIYIC
jgi:hypothetical protein